MSSYDRPNVSGRTTAPGVFLIITGVLNLLTSLGLILWGFGMATMANNPEFQREFKRGFDEEMQKNKDLNPEERKQAEAIGKAMQEGMAAYGMGAGIYGVISVLCSLIILIGGITMMSMKSYGLSMFASVLALLPCSSPCCLLGLISGIWGIAVLMSPDVKAAFR